MSKCEICDIEVPEQVHQYARLFSPEYMGYVHYMLFCKDCFYNKLKEFISSEKKNSEIRRNRLMKPDG